MKKMKAMLVTSTLVGLCAGPLMLAPADVSAKGKKMHDESAQQATKRLGKQRQVSGTVLDTKMVKFKGTNQANTIALLKTKKNDRRLTVDLGPKDELNKLKVKKGQQLAVQGIVVNVGDQQVLIADKVKAGDKTIEIDRVPQLKSMQKSQAKGKEAPQQKPNKQ